MKYSHLAFALVLAGFSTGCGSKNSGTANVGTDPLLAPHRSFTVVDADSEDEFIQAFADNADASTRLAPDYMVLRLNDLEHADPEVKLAYYEHRDVRSVETEAALIRALELDFIHNPDTSSLDLLNPEMRVHFHEFDWHPDDYVGGADGPNEKLADIITDSMDIVSPERRANRSRTAIILKEEATDEIWEYLLSQWTPVPGEGNWKLNRHAKDSYVAMREAAAADGVMMKIRSGHRDPERAAANAARAGNRFAVASFSSHSLGLAIDFALPKADSDEIYRLTTSPMSEVVEMRKSPTHKWLHIYGYKHGWFPFQHEPWHWEYNPPGFRDVFWADFEGEVPVRD